LYTNQTSSISKKKQKINLLCKLIIFFIFDKKLDTHSRIEERNISQERQHIGNIEFSYKNEDIIFILF